jgi:hypothetical protein
LGSLRDLFGLVDGRLFDVGTVHGDELPVRRGGRAERVDNKGPQRLRDGGLVVGMRGGEAKLVRRG